jgi:hypothetical protein
MSDTLRKTLWILLGVVGTLLAVFVGLIVYFRATSERIPN